MLVVWTDDATNNSLEDTLGTINFIGPAQNREGSYFGEIFEEEEERRSMGESGRGCSRGDKLRSDSYVVPPLPLFSSPFKDGKQAILRVAKNGAQNDVVPSMEGSVK